MLEKNLGYEFCDKLLLNNALTHKSYLRKSEFHGNNERLEFLGDSVLGFTVAEYLYKNYKDLPEGELTKIRANVVCEECLYKVALKIGLGERIYLGKGEEHSDGRRRPSILSDALEAVFAAIYLDGGIDSAKKVILNLLKDEIEVNVKRRNIKDYKTVLQEFVQKGNAFAPTYEIIDEKGPDHDKIFTATVSLDGNVIGQGSGRTKKDAEKEAAKVALSKLGII